MLNYDDNEAFDAPQPTEPAAPLEIELPIIHPYARRCYDGGQRAYALGLAAMPFNDLDFIANVPEWGGYELMRSNSYLRGWRDAHAAEKRRARPCQDAIDAAIAEHTPAAAGMTEDHGVLLIARKGEITPVFTQTRPVLWHLFKDALCAIDHDGVVSYAPGTAVNNC